MTDRSTYYLRFERLNNLVRLSSIKEQSSMMQQFSAVDFVTIRLCNGSLGFIRLKRQLND